MSPNNGSSLLKACLVAPSRKPSLSSAQNESLNSQKFSNKSSDRFIAFSTSINEAVKNAYRDVKSKRSSTRAKLVRSVLAEHLDNVILNSLIESKTKDVSPKDRDLSEIYDHSINSHEDRNKRAKEKHEHKNKEVNEIHDYKNGSPKNKEIINSEDDDPYSSTLSGVRAFDTVQKSDEQLEGNEIKQLIFPRLPSNNCNTYSYCVPESIGYNNFSSKCYNLSPDKKHSISIKLNHGSQSDLIIHQPLLLEGTHPSQPIQSSVVFLKSFFSANDERNLAHVPYFGEDENPEDFHYDLFDMEERMKLHEYGPPYCEKESIETIDEVLILLAESEPAWFENNRTNETPDEDNKITSYNPTIREVHAILAMLSNVSVNRVQERHVICFGKEKYDGTPKVNKQNSQTKTDDQGSPAQTHRKNCTKEDPKSYKEAIDSYRDLFCRLCFTYDCQIHGNIPKVDLQLLGELAMAKDHEGHWKKLDKDVEGHSSKPVESQTLNKKITDVDLAVCERLYLAFHGNIEHIAKVLNVTTKAVSDAIIVKKLELQPPMYVKLAETSKKRKRKYEHAQSMKNYNPRWLANIQRCEIHPAFIPCNHIESCNEKICSCVRNKFFCNKACAWGSKSKNFFRGCACKAGQCRSVSCPCWAATRECDPDLCRTCGACTDPAQQRANKQRCRNDNISMRRHAHLLLAKSSINAAGWGIFTKHSLQKGSYIHEYVGEVISQEEAERRGVIYDRLNMSYLFNLTSDCTVDATRKGNKVRYANHNSTAPNCEAKMIRVNGDMRIGMFAKVDIDAQSELFFDYRYDETIDNDLIIKPAHKFQWMKSPRMIELSEKSSANNISMKAAKKNA